MIDILAYHIKDFGIEYQPTDRTVFQGILES
jgi:hypothetical protein